MPYREPTPPPRPADPPEIERIELERRHMRRVRNLLILLAALFAVLGFTPAAWLAHVFAPSFGLVALATAVEELHLRRRLGAALRSTRELPQ